MKRILSILAIAIIISLFYTCKRFDINPKTKVETGKATPLALSITIEGKIVDLGGEGNDDCGFCYATHTNPTTSDNKISKGKPSIGSISATIDGLTLNTKYYYRAYCYSSGDIVYGNILSTITLDGKSVIYTSTASNITAKTAACGGQITADGGSPITMKGVAWSTLQNPTIKTNQGIVQNGSGIGNFTSNLTDLVPNSTYYIRAFAANKIDTSYGNQQTIKTLDGIIVLTTNAASNITGSSCTSGGNITSDGGDPITERGVVWSTSQDPTIETNLEKVASGKGTGYFSCSITNLSPSIVYYVRAYATNSLGTRHGMQSQFTTTIGLPQLTTNTINAITASSSVTGGTISSDGGYTITARGVVWSNIPNPTTNSNLGFTNNGNGIGSFTSVISGLNSSTLYYVRAYVTNSKGTAYGEEFNFTTLGGADIAEIWEYNPIADSWKKNGIIILNYRSSPLIFSSTQKAYFGLGGPSPVYNDFYEIDITSNTITRKTDFPEKETVFRTGYSIGNLGYIGGGCDCNNCWSFDPSLNSWTQKANIGGVSYRYLAVSFSIGGKGYISTGGITPYLKDIWEYNTTTNNWSRKNDFPGIARWGAIGFAIGNKGYIGGGAYEGSNFPTDFYEFDPISNTWTRKADLPATFYCEPSFVIGTKAYVINYSTIYEYNQLTNIWTKKNNAPNGFYYTYGFSINGKGYILVIKNTSKSNTPKSDQEKMMMDLERLKMQMP